MKQNFKKETSVVDLLARDASKEKIQIMEVLTTKDIQKEEKSVTAENQQKKLTREEIRKIIEEEKKMGLSLRCEWCPENIFCSAYLLYVKKEPNEIPRCDNLFSER